MAPASKPGGSSSSNKKARKNSQQYTEESGNPDSPSARTYSSPSPRKSNNGGGGNKGHRRRKSSPTNPRSALRETLSSFGDDVIKAKHYPKIYGYDNHGYFHPDDVANNSVEQDDIAETSHSSHPDPFGNGNEKKLSRSSVVDKGIRENELAMIMSHHDPSFSTKRFEKVNPSEVGVRYSKWQKLLQISTTANKLQRLKTNNSKISKGSGSDWTSSSDTKALLENFYNRNGKLDLDPPFWGVSRQTRSKIPTLGIALILHELACFTSCILLGCTIFQGMEAISWAKQRPFLENGFFFKWYSSFQTLLVVITCVGFLNRLDTTERRSLWIFPVFLFPVLCLSVSDYCNKAMELQRLECISFHNLNPISQKAIHLSQDCSLVLAALKYENMKTVLNQNMTNATDNNNASNRVTKNQHSQNNINNYAASFKTEHQTSTPKMTELDVRGVSPLAMRIISALSTLVISTYLFCCRKTYFLIDLFGPPDELKGSIDLISTADPSGKQRNVEASPRMEDSDEFEVIFQRK